MKTRRILLMLSLCGLVGGCNLAPDYQRPEISLQDSFPGEDTGGTMAQEVSWERFFGDEQLKFLVARGLERNHDLTASVARIEQASALYRIEQANRLPRLDAGAGASRNQAPLSSLDPVFADSRSTIQFNQLNVQAGISAFEIDFWGRVRNLSESARHQYLATVEARRPFACP